MTTKLALFDLDNTLIDRSELFGEWALDFLRGHDRDDEHELVWLVEQDGDGLTPKDAFFEAVRSRYEIDAATDELVAAYYATYPLFTRPLTAGLSAALATLRSDGWRLGIVTNGPPMQEQVVDRAGLRDLVDAVCVSATIGRRKPDPQIFRVAAERCGTDLSGAWMIGDSATHDIRGAVASGIDSVWVARDRDWSETAYQPTLIAKTVTDAVSLVIARGN
jgi:HAD superfamily hydrolase (TIGR01509 family)